MTDVRLYMNRVNGWDKMDTAMIANNGDVAHLTFRLPALRERSQRMRSLYAQHAALAATRQAITQEMEQLIEEGDQIFRGLKEGLRDYYGKRNRKLVEFGVDPLPSRPGAGAGSPQPPPLPEAPAPLVSAPDPEK